ncbi:MAG: putative calcium binding hemolysin protein, partial [Firmicutes bacterium]|nr:putative calcium binding hemolysin protein [Bacillota bacterium]
MENGNDTLIGDELANTLVGDSGNDILDGGAGNDTLSGGGGNDIYKFSRGYGNDTILADISNNKDNIV